MNDDDPRDLFADDYEFDQTLAEYWEDFWAATLHDARYHQWQRCPSHETDNNDE